jgi:hypothetical protein
MGQEFGNKLKVLIFQTSQQQIPIDDQFSRLAYDAIYSGKQSNPCPLG